MKRWWHMALVLVVLTGCQREQLPEGDPMDFSVASSLQTKSPAAEQPDDESFLIAQGNQVRLYGTWSKAGQEDEQIFTAQTLTCQEDLSWDYTPVKYWRKYGTYSFAAVYPMTECLAGTSGKGLLVRHSLVYSANPVDLMVAHARRTVASDFSPVELPFKHACAAVRFLFKRASASYSYHLKSFQLENLRVSGTLDTSGGNLSLSSWHTSGLAPDDEVYPWEASTVSDYKEIPLSYDDYTTQAQWYYMIPQRMSPESGYAHPAVTFSVIYNNEPTPVTTTLLLPDSYVEGGVPVEAVWEPGKVYNYYINLQPSRVAITVHVTDWEEKTLVVNDLTFD